MAALPKDTTTDKTSGLVGKLAVLTLWYYGVVWVGVVKGLGVMLPTLQTQFETNAGILGWLIAMIGCIGGIAGELLLDESFLSNIRPSADHS